MDESKLFIDEVNIMRRRLDKEADVRGPEFLGDLLTRLEESDTLRHQPIVQAFMRDIDTYAAQPRLVGTKAHINAAPDNHVFSYFDASYFPKLSLDYLVYDPLPADRRLTDRYGSHTTPVNIRACTDGFASRVVVALFPENHLDGIQDPDDRIFYFINKFVDRHNRVTRRMIDHVMAPGSFLLIQDAPDGSIETASTWWVHLHEYHHRQGDMPIPEFLDAKKIKPLAGLEELRTDVSSMLVCLTDSSLPSDEARMAFEYILAERLLRYAVEGIPRPNYDAIASQLLFNYLTVNNGIALRDERIHLTPRLPQALARFLHEIQTIERRIRTEPVEDVRAGLLAFTNAHTDYDKVARDYRHIPFFAEVKQRLGV